MQEIIISGESACCHLAPFTPKSVEIMCIKNGPFCPYYKKLMRLIQGRRNCGKSNIGLIGISALRCGALVNLGQEALKNFSIGEDGGPSVGGEDSTPDHATYQVPVDLCILLIRRILPFLQDRLDHHPYLGPHRLAHIPGNRVASSELRRRLLCKLTQRLIPQLSHGRLSEPREHHRGPSCPSPTQEW